MNTSLNVITNVGMRLVIYTVLGSIGAATARVARVRTLPTFEKVKLDPPNFLGRTPQDPPNILSMQTTQQLLMNLRNDDAFNQIYKETLELCKKLDYPVPKLPRKRRLATKLAGNSASYEWATPEEFHRAQYFAFIDTACEALARRYNQPGLNKYADMEKLLNKQSTAAEVERVVKDYPELEADRLYIQLSMLRQLSTSVSDNVSLSTVDNFVSFIKS